MSSFLSAIIRPVISEKATALAKEGQYVFAVGGKTTKIDVKNAIFHLYGVKAEKVTMTRLPGKARRVGRGFTRSKRGAMKKAIVCLQGKKTIDIYKLNSPKAKAR